MSRVGCFLEKSPIISLLLFLTLSCLVPFIMPLADPPLLAFPEITFSSLNCNSLNMSTISSVRQKQKIYAITKLKTDFIFLSDIRLGGLTHENKITELENSLLFNPHEGYKLIHNSNKSSRGVGILIKHNLPVLVLAEARDHNSNILALHCSLHDSEFVIVSIYGPNKNCPEFFTDMENIFNTVSHLPIIIGGDWNCTVSNEPVAHNLDCFNMKNLPSLAHSNLLKKLMTKFSLCDAYRCYFPLRKDYTFVPRDVTKTNRSRLDFFLISEKLVTFSSGCDIELHLQCYLFDHKAIKLSFCKLKNKSKNSYISKYILNDKLTDCVVYVAAAECYANHCPELAVRKNAICESLARLRMLIRQAGPQIVNIVGVERDLESELRRDNIIAEILGTLDDLNTSNYQNLGLNIDDDIFLEYLVNCVRNDVVSFQTYSAKVFNTEKTRLINILRLAKSTDTYSPTLYADTESQLNALCDTQMRTEFLKLRNHEILNNEKITPFFVKMASCAKPSHKISDICDNYGKPFINNDALSEFVVNYFQCIYTKSTDEPADLSGCIENFLGPEILANNIVVNSKLSKNEAAQLEIPLSLFELDEASKQANTKSAPGIDGLSTEFILKYWKVFRVPLHRYANICFLKGELSATFKSANIRLIPKKGSPANIKNWRPISLLSNLYKILSRALNNRLKKPTDRITSRAQKGFTNSRYLQEVLINVTEFIGHCKANDKSGLILSIDYSKAFDSLSINFLRECYNFFGFGKNFTNMLETVGKNRKAAIILDDGQLSRQINLETGRPQGENLSPGQYNIGNQIMLFRIELDPKVASVFQHFLSPLYPFPLVQNSSRANEKFAFESNRETDKVEGFADDTSTTTECNEETVTSIKNILTDFSVISGLKCNFEKTSVIPVGLNPMVPDWLLNCGFRVENEFKLLGMTIDQKAEKLLDNFDTTIKKMRNVANFWSKFKFSLPGRIAVANTYLLSQINHIGCFLTPSDYQLNIMQGIIDSFCIGALNVSSTRRYLPAKMGGLGLIKISDFIIAQQSMWVKRAFSSTRDNWRIDLTLLGRGNIFAISPADISPIEHPVLHGIANSFFAFTGHFSSLKNNFEFSYIFNNPIFVRGAKDNGILDAKFFGGTTPDKPNIYKIVNLKYGDCWEGGEFLSLDRLNSDFSLNLTAVIYFRLRCALLYFKSKNKTNSDLDGSGISDFFKSFKKGSKSCRKIIGRSSILKNKIVARDQSCVITFFGLLDLDIPTDDNLSKFLDLWTLHYLNNKFREFIFKFYNNKLGLNQRTAHFLGTSNNCTFCDINGFNDQVESFIHLFYSCPTVIAIRNSLDNIILNPVHETENEKKSRWFGCGFLQVENRFIRLVHLSLQFFIWESKLKRILPTSEFILGETIEMLDIACSCNTDLQFDRVNYNCNLTRVWDTIRARIW